MGDICSKCRYNSSICSKEGQYVSFAVDAYPDYVFHGNVTQVRLDATTNSNVLTYEVEIDAPNIELKLKHGLIANVMIFTLQLKDVVVIPAIELRFKPDSQLLGLVGAKGITFESIIVLSLELN